MGRSAVRLLFVKAGELVHQAALGRDCCAGIMPATGRALPPISCRPPGSLRGRRSSPPHETDPDEAGRRRDPCGARVDRHRRRALLHARRAGDPRRRSRCSVSSATGCRSITTRRRCGRWRRMSTRSRSNYNVDSADGWIADYFFDGLRKLSGGKPVLISEWFFAARENRTGNRNNGHLMTVATQERAGYRRGRRHPQFRGDTGNRRGSLVPVLRPPERRASRRRGLRFRAGRHQRPAVSSG